MIDGLWASEHFGVVVDLSRAGVGNPPDNGAAFPATARRKG
jgi:hypothetical protein